jgi:Arc/MetJ-type ribon-helix-helix transcriptional regulator
MLSFKPSVTLTRALYDRARSHAARAGYSSVDEFVRHVVERELAKTDEGDMRDDIERKLKGLGYLK